MTAMAGSTATRRAAASSRGERAKRRPSVSENGGLDGEIAAAMPGLKRYARSLTRNPAAADDLVQETLTRGIERLRLWRPGTDLRAWLFTIMHNQHVDSVRRRAREGIPVEPSEGDPHFVCPAQQVDRLLLRDLRRALAQLPDEQRSVVLLVGLGGERYSAVASRLDIPIGTVRSRAFRGRQTMRRLMDGAPEPAPAAPISPRAESGSPT